jgi:NADPH-dependent curcumin reductase CurA
VSDEQRQVVIAALPTGALQATDFEVRTAPVPEPAAGQVLARTLAITIGAGQRAGLQGSASYAGAPEVGMVMGGTGVAQVVRSADPTIRDGDWIWAPTGWQEYSVHQGRAVTVVDPSIDAADHLGVLGTNGLTAYFGTVDVGGVKAGETFLVSAAAGSVGHIAGQIARARGARVVGVTGSEDKNRMLMSELGFDATVNRRDPDFRNAFRAATPNRIDVYFDNTGGDILESALFRMNRHGRIVCCGAASQYDTTTPAPGPRGVPGLLVNNRVRMEGFLVFDFLDQYAAARAQLAAWLRDGTVRSKTTEYDGLDAAPQAFIDLLAGVTVGTTIVRVAS